MTSSKDCSLFIKETYHKVKNITSYQVARRLIFTSITPLKTSFANVVKTVSGSVGTQTSLSWPIGNDKPKTISLPEFATPVGKITTSSSSTQTVKPNTGKQNVNTPAYKVKYKVPSNQHNHKPSEHKDY